MIWPPAGVDDNMMTAARTVDDQPGGPAVGAHESYVIFGSTIRFSLATTGFLFLVALQRSLKIFDAHEEFLFRDG